MHMSEHTDTGAHGIPAATVVIFRNAPQGGPPEILMTIRSREMVFAGGMAVFPGGRVDPADFDLGASMGGPLDPDEAAHQVAVVRETLEETGLVIGEAYVAIRGVIDVPIHTFGMRETSVELDVVSEMELLMFNDEDRVMSPAFHHRVWPGELGMDHCTGVTDNGYWGQNPPSGGVQTTRGMNAIRQAIENRPNVRL